MKKIITLLMLICLPVTMAQAATLTPLKEFQGSLSSSNQAAETTLRNDSDWLSTFYNNVSATSIPLRPAGTIGLAVFLGPRGTSGYKVNPLGIYAINHKIYVDYEEARIPGSPISSSPYYIAAVATSNLQIEVIYTQNRWDWAGAIWLKTLRFFQGLVYSFL